MERMVKHHDILSTSECLAYLDSQTISRGARVDQDNLPEVGGDERAELGKERLSLIDIDTVNVLPIPLEITSMTFTEGLNHTRVGVAYMSYTCSTVKVLPPLLIIHILPLPPHYAGLGPGLALLHNLGSCHPSHYGVDSPPILCPLPALDQLLLPLVPHGHGGEGD